MQIGIEKSKVSEYQRPARREAWIMWWLTMIPLMMLAGFIAYYILIGGANERKKAHYSTHAEL